MLYRLRLAVEIWLLQRRIASKRRRLKNLELEYFSMESALLRQQISKDESHLKELNR